MLNYGKNQDYNNYDRGTIVYGYYPGDYAARSPNPNPGDWSMGMHLTHFSNTLVGSFYSSPFNGALPSDTVSMNLERSINRSLTLSGFENFRIGWSEFDGHFPVACRELRIMYK